MAKGSPICMFDRSRRDAQSNRFRGLQGFYARPQKKGDVLDLLVWEVGIPGKEGVGHGSARHEIGRPAEGALNKTPWENGIYKVIMTFPEEYPAKPPKCRLFSYISMCLITAENTWSRQANLIHLFSTPTFTRLARSVCPFSTRKRRGNLLSRSSKSASAYKIFLIPLITKTLLKQKLLHCLGN